MQDDGVLGDGPWAEWMEAISRTGYTEALQKASKTMAQLDNMTVHEVETLFTSHGKDTCND